MTQHDLLYWYEDNLPSRERKVRGHFSTPPGLVEQILDACAYTPDQDLSRLRILDPACGSGNFLAGATRRLIAHAEQTGMRSQALARCLRQNIWGFDPDPIACFLADMQIRSTISTSVFPTATPGRLHIHQADGLAFPWDHKTNIDLFLANPPYLATKNTDLSGYRTSHARGQSDSYLFFLDLALQVVRPNGWIALVVPDPVLARTNATRERKRLLAETTIYHLWHLADVFTASVGAVVIIAQKHPPTIHHHIQWRRERWSRNVHEREGDIPLSEMAVQSSIVSQNLLCQQPNAELRYLLSTSKGTLIEHLQTRLHSMQATMPAIKRTLSMLGEFVLIRRGEEIGKDSLLLRDTPPESHPDEWYPLLRGGIDIRPYTVPRARRWIERKHIIKQLERYLAPKLLIVKSAGRLQATLDLGGHVVLQTLYILRLKVQQPTIQSPAFSAEDELYYLLALLNSRVLLEYIHILYTAYKWVQPQIEQHVLANLPIPIKIDYTEKEQIISRSRLLMHACSELTSVVELKEYNQELYEEQERAIRTLYETALHEGRPFEPPPDIVDKGVIVYG